MREVSRPPLFPVFLDLAGTRVVVIGGGAVAARKVQALLAAGAQVTVVAPEMGPEVQALSGNANLECLRRAYAPGDVAGKALAFAATDEAEVNAAVFAEAQAAGVWVNVVDDPAHCSFHVPAQLTRGPVSIAISTLGDSPALARHLRERIEEAVPPEYGELAQLLGRLREEVKTRFAAQPERARRWQAVLDQEGVLALLSQGKAAEAEALARRLLGLEGEA